MSAGVKVKARVASQPNSLKPSWRRIVLWFLAPKARQYSSQGQALNRAKRVAPGLKAIMILSTESAKYPMRFISLFQSSPLFTRGNQGRRASRCSALAPGYHIPRLWRCLSQYERPLTRKHERPLIEETRMTIE